MSCEVFEYAGRAYDVEAALRALEAGRLPRRRVTLGIRAKARERLGGPKSSWVVIPYAVRLAADPARLEEPGLILARPPRCTVVIDGNHRLVARWLNGLTTMDFYALTESEVPRAYD